MIPIIFLALLSACNVRNNDYRIVYSYDRLVTDSSYTLELLPAQVVVSGKVYKNQKLCFQTKVIQKFYLASNYPAKHSSQWQAQIQAAQDKIKDKVLLAKSKQGNKFCSDN